ncbi:MULTISPECIES: hypothetical protein [unclassified Sphingobium]|uniref:hypothetical protein n=1 Tax=unclassified Sphingobium TaxID=2611147 RepID=UPI0035A5E335
MPDRVAILIQQRNKRAKRFAQPMRVGSAGVGSDGSAALGSRSLPFPSIAGAMRCANAGEDRKHMTEEAIKIVRLFMIKPIHPDASKHVPNDRRPVIVDV